MPIVCCKDKKTLVMIKNAQKLWRHSFVREKRNYHVKVMLGLWLYFPVLSHAPSSSTTNKISDNLGQGLIWWLACGHVDIAQKSTLSQESTSKPDFRCKDPFCYKHTCIAHPVRISGGVGVLIQIVI
jgi:hypothetical protein